MTSWNYSDRDREERPEPTVESVPDDVIEGALDIAVAWKKCPGCSVEQFINIVPGHNTSHECKNCGESYKVIG
jgi:hypothetical protein